MNPRPQKQMGVPARQTKTMPQPASVKPVVTEQPKPVQKKSSIKREHITKSENGYTIEVLAAYLKGMTQGIAYIDDETMNKNIECAYGKGMTADDRTVSYECADYIVSNMAYIIMGLVMDKNFKQAFLDSLVLELKIDSLAPEVKAKTRHDMKDGKPYKSQGSVTLGLTAFTHQVGAKMLARMEKGFDSLDKFADEFDEEARKLTNDDRAELGFIFSNFMFMMRAFTHNDVFLSYVITVIEKVKQLAGA